MRTRSKVLVAVAAIALVVGALFGGLTLAQPGGTVNVPTIMNYQGTLLDAFNDPVSGDLEFTFAIYDSATDGHQLWTETQSVTVDNGYYSVTLGEIEAIEANVFDETATYLEIWVEGEVTTPRHQLASVPYAFQAENAQNAVQAENAQTLDGQSASDFVGTGEDYGRSGVATDLYEGTETLTDKYVNETSDTMVGSSSVPILSVTNSGSGHGIMGDASGVFGNGVHGIAIGTIGAGVMGWGEGIWGYGVYGKATGNSGYGVYGEATGSSGYGVYGEATGANAYAGYFEGDVYVTGDLSSESLDDKYVNESGDTMVGSSSAPILSVTNSGSGNGVYAEATGPNAYAGYFEGDVHVTGDLDVGGTITMDPRLRFYSVPACAFQPRTSGDVFVRVGQMIENMAGVEDDYYWYAPVNLPHGAVVTELLASLIDYDDGVDITCSLQRVSQTDTSGTSEIMAEVVSAGMSLDLQHPTDSSIVNATIDNAAYMYFVEAVLRTGFMDHQLSSVRITYEIVQPLP